MEEGGRELSKSVVGWAQSPGKKPLLTEKLHKKRSGWAKRTSE